LKNTHNSLRHLVYVGLLSFASIATAQNGDVEHRIKRVEAGLIPPLVTQATKSMHLLERMKQLDVPAVSIAVIENGKIVWARAYGVRDANTQVPATPDTAFQAASISKPVSAMAALKLVEMGKLTLDEDINKKLTSWKLPDNEFTAKEKVTLRRILTHRAGLTVSGFPGYAAGAAIPSTVQVLDGAKPADTSAVRVDVTPQSQSRYSGGGFTIMQLLLEDVSAKPFPQLLEELVLKPIGMKQSAFAQPPSDMIKANIAAAHSPGAKVVNGGFRTYPEFAAAGLWTTPSDLARFAIELQRVNAGATDGVFSPAMAQQMLTLTDDRWGLGIVLAGAPNAQRFLHQGANEGFQCLMVAYKNGGGAVVMSNSSAAYPLIQEVMRAIAVEYQWPGYVRPRVTTLELPPETLAQYAGFYQASPNESMRIQFDGKQLTGSGSSGNLTLLAGSASTFFSTDGTAQVDFVKKSNGEIQSLSVRRESSVSPALLRTLEKAAPFKTTAFYVRGSMNDWSLAAPMSAAANDIYTARVSMKVGSYEFKLGSDDFKAIDFGGSPTQSNVSINTAKLLSPSGKNLTLSIPTEATYLFTLDTKKPLEPMLTVTNAP
jgi:CubicO group peptidase (beta-lactamase class C family)